MLVVLIPVGLLVLAVAVLALRRDRRARGYPSWSDGHARGNPRTENQYRADRWGGPGA